MSLSEDVRPLLAARAAIDPNAARLLEMFARAYETLSEHSLERIGDDEMPLRQSLLIHSRCSPQSSEGPRRGLVNIAHFAGCRAPPGPVAGAKSRLHALRPSELI